VSAFSITHLSLVRRVRSGDADTRARAQDALAAVYWAPIYAHVRLTHQVTPQDAEDLTQGFFAEALRRDLFARYEPARARFRAYVRSCVDEYVDNLRKWERPLRRAGRWNALPLDLVELESRLTSDVDPDAIFHREWARSVLVTALGRLRERYVEAGKHTHLALFERYDIIGSTAQQRPTYAQLAAELEITISQATSWLAAARRDFRSIVLETLRDLSGNDEEYRAEARALLGVDSL
jgi:RNA polymerase sigma factor (sigma-70 family)